MKLGYTTDDSKPTAIALSGGAGYAWLTADAGTACFDRDPQSKSRFRWRNDAVPALAHQMVLALTLTAATPVGICAFLGLGNVPVGTMVRVYGKRVGDATAAWDFGGQNSTTVVKLADGTYAAWFVLPTGAAPVTQVAFVIYNNVAGATWATAATTVDVGELVALPCVTLPVQQGWYFDTIDPSDFSVTRGGIPVGSTRIAYRRLVGQFVPQETTAIRNGGLANGMDMAKLTAALRGRARCVAIPQYRDATGALSAALIAATATYGYASKLPQIGNVQRQYFGGDFAIDEIPAI